MVISTNSQGAAGNPVNPAAVQQSRSGGRPAAVGSSSPADETVEIAITPRNASSGLAEIEDELQAEESTGYARRYILEEPSRAIGVQANARPEVVFELLQGILA